MAEKIAPASVGPDIGIAEPQGSVERLAVVQALEAQLGRENPDDRYDFESVLDESGFGYKEELPALTSNRRLWEVRFD